MDKSLTEWKKYVAHYCWQHMDDLDKSFFKFMIGDFKNGLTIPEKFACNFRGQISEVVKLETRDGNTYNVQVTKELNNLVLRSGWARFANAYELEKGDLLVFFLSGDSQFEVLIYDRSTCRKELSYVVTNHFPCVHERSTSHDNHMLSPKSGKLAKRRKTSKRNPADCPLQKSTERDLPPSGGIQDTTNSGGLHTSTKYHYILARGCNLTRAHKVKVDTLELKIRPEIPLYVTALNETSLFYGYLVICKDYAAQHLPHRDETITLCHPSNSKTWDADLKISTDGTYILSAGWSGFVRDNKLQEDDVCIFEVSKSQRRHTMTVHMLKASYHPPDGITSSGSTMYGDSPLGYVVSQKTHLNDQQKSKVGKMVEAIQSETPIFVFVKGHSGNNYSLTFKKDYAVKYLPDEEQNVWLRRPENNSTDWEAKFKIIDHKRELYGWTKFVTDNQLRPGDICLFERLKMKELTMNVHIIRGEREV